MAFNLGFMGVANPTLPDENATDPLQQDLPVLLGRRPPAVQTLPARPSSEAADAEMRLVLRRRRRAQTATIRSTSDLFAALGMDAIDTSESVIVQSILRPPRVILSTTEGRHSLCLPKDCEARVHFVLAGLPAGPVLPKNEVCAICLDPFQTGERVQLTAVCRHAFHAGCIKMFLQSQFMDRQAFDSGTPCPLCRGPLMATSTAQVPIRERPLAITVNAAWLHSEEIANSDNEDYGNLCAVAGHPKATKCHAMSTSRVTLIRALTAPIENAGFKRHVLVHRAVTASLEDVCKSGERALQEASI